MRAALGRASRPCTPRARSRCRSPRSPHLPGSSVYPSTSNMWNEQPLSGVRWHSIGGCGRSSPTATLLADSVDVKGLFAPEVVADPFPVYDRSCAPRACGADERRRLGRDALRRRHRRPRTTALLVEHAAHRQRGAAPDTDHLRGSARPHAPSQARAAGVHGEAHDRAGAVGRRRRRRARLRDPGRRRAGRRLEAFCDPLPVRAITRIIGVPQSGTSTSRRGPTSEDRSPGAEQPDSPEEASTSRPRRRRTAGCSSTSSPRRAPGGRRPSTT